MKSPVPFLILTLIIMAYTASSAQVPASQKGVFESLTDIGEPGHPGKVLYLEDSQEYLLEGSGENIWFGADQFSFLWKQMEGDYIIQARLEFPEEGAQPHRKAGIMIRSSLSPGAAHVSCVVHGDGLTSLQYREREGEDMQEVKSGQEGPCVIQLEKKGKLYTMSVAHRGATYTRESVELAMEGPQLAGLFICSHDDRVVEKARFSNVRVFGTAPDTLVPYEQYIGSLLEVMDVASGHRKVLDAAPGSWQAPNWTRNGKALIYNADGLLYRYDLSSGESAVLPTGFADANNNDHVISFDGTRLAISHHAPEDQGRSVVYTLPIEGGIPRRVTPLSPSYLHGWSPGDRHLVYTGGRKGIYNIYRIPAEGGEEVQLTDLSTLDDGPEFSPDGKFIYFNSARTGTMQLWRMDPEGKNPTQLTFDHYNDWFPHVSPDGKWIAFVSFPPEVPADDHPFYKRVYLRLMSVEDLEPRVIGYVYGGQGSMNVPSWSPDSRKIAFISNGIF